MIKNILVTIGIVGALAIGFAAYNKPTTDTKTIGAISGPDIASPYFSVGSLVQYKAHVALYTATNTPCTIQSPNSTSTMTSELQVTTGITGATTWRIATSTVPNATTTSIATFSLLSGAQGSFAQGSVSSAPLIVPPNTYVTWDVEGVVNADPTKLLGTCNATFTVM